MVERKMALSILKLCSVPLFAIGQMPTEVPNYQIDQNGTDLQVIMSQPVTNPKQRYNDPGKPEGHHFVPWE